MTKQINYNIILYNRINALNKTVIQKKSAKRVMDGESMTASISERKSLRSSVAETTVSYDGISAVKRENI